jgi:hypothetical protein
MGRITFNFDTNWSFYETDGAPTKYFDFGGRRSQPANL